MLPDDELRQKLSKRYTRLAIISAYLLALFWPLGSFFFWIFFGAMAYFGFLVFYYQPKRERQQTNFNFGNNRPSGSSPGDVPPVQNSGKQVNPKTVRLIVFFGIAFTFFLFFIIFLIGLFSGDASEAEAPISDSKEEQRALLESNPNDIDALINIGNSFYSAQEYDSALKYYDKVLNIESGNYSGMYNKALVHFEKKEYSRSIELMRRCAQQYPDSPDPLVLLGDNYYTQNNYNDAIVWYKQAYDKGGRYAGQLNIMGYIYDTQNNTGNAIKYYKEALQQDSSLVEIYTRLAELEPSQAEWYKKKAAAFK